MLDYVLSLIARFFNLFLSALPIGAALGIGRFFGAIAYFVNYKRAKVAYANMRAAFAGEKEPAEIRRLVKSLYGNFGQTLVEIVRMPSIDKSYMEKYIKVEGFDKIKQTLEKWHGVIFLTGHFGNWELCSIASALRGYPIFVLAREQKMARLNNLLNMARESKGCKVIKKGMAAREIYEHLKNNGIVGILSDQDAGKKGVFINFFGRPTSSPRGAFALARKTGALIIPAFAVRTGGPYHTIFLESPIEVSNDDNSDHSEFKSMQKFASLLESYIRKTPEQWLWLHKRWKSTPLRKVVILSDGKKGHLNQSLSVFGKIKESRCEFGCNDIDTEQKIIEIRYKSGLKRLLLTVSAPLLSNFCLLRMKLLKYCLENGSYDEIKSAYADIVISCGSGTAAANILIARENCAKNVIVMRPSLLSPRNFDIVIMPEHDRPPRGENVVKTIGMPNTITPKKMESDLKALEEAAELNSGKNIALFIGGDNKNYSVDAPLIKNVAENVLAAARELGAGILVTTSRRTSGEVNGLLKAELGGNDLVKLLIIAGEQNPEWAVGGILGASSIAVVSGESTSMLSEAASSGRHVIAFRPRRKPGGRGNKHEVFLKRLSSAGFIHISEPDSLKDDIIGLMESEEEPKKLNDNEKIYEAVKKIV